MLIEGNGYDPDGKVTFNAFATIPTTSRVGDTDWPAAGSISPK
jgi:hypothetical protein